MSINRGRFDYRVTNLILRNDFIDFHCSQQIKSIGFFFQFCFHESTMNLVRRNSTTHPNPALAFWACNKTSQIFFPPLFVFTASCSKNFSLTSYHRGLGIRKLHIVLSSMNPLERTLMASPRWHDLFITPTNTRAISKVLCEHLIKVFLPKVLRQPTKMTQKRKCNGESEELAYSLIRFTECWRSLNEAEWHEAMDSTWLLHYSIATNHWAQASIRFNRMIHRGFLSNIILRCLYWVQ